MLCKTPEQSLELLKIFVSCSTWCGKMPRACPSAVGPLRTLVRGDYHSDLCVLRSSGSLPFLCCTRVLISHLSGCHAAMPFLGFCCFPGASLCRGGWRHTSWLPFLSLHPQADDFLFQEKSDFLQIFEQNVPTCSLFIQQILTIHPLSVRTLSKCQGCNNEQRQVPALRAQI
jgi:hypothetical protein